MFECGVSTLVLSLVGTLYLFFFLLDSVWSVLQAISAILALLLLFAQVEETSLVDKYGQWALVTGCTDGIGKEYATELAKRGLNIVLISRNPEKLFKTAKELEDVYSVKTKIIAADFSLGPKAVETIKNELGSLEIGILVNNVGKQYDYPMYLDEVQEKDLWEIININVGAVTLLCRMFVGQMRQRKRGAIVNVSSGSELMPLPLMTVYAASKAYIRSFTTALRCEYAGSGVTIQHLAPMFVNTKMNHFSSKLRETSTFVPDASSFAKYAVSTLGVIDSTSGYWSHGIQTFFCSIPPVWIRMYIGAYMNRAFRKDYLNQKMKTQ